MVERFVTAAFGAVDNGSQLVADLRAIRSAWNERIRARRDAAAWRIADLVFQRPVINAATIAQHLDLAPSNVYRSLRPLEDAGVLVGFSDHKRNQLWRAPEILDALDRFASRAGRRNRSTRRLLGAIGSRSAVSADRS